MIEGVIVITAIAAFLLWRFPIVVFLGLFIWSLLAWPGMVDGFPAGSGLVLLAAVAFSVWRWPHRPHAACGGTGRNHGSTRAQFGTCPGCQGGRIWMPGARLVARITGSRYHVPS
jgi:hypothetical protein